MLLKDNNNESSYSRQFIDTAVLETLTACDSHFKEIARNLSMCSDFNLFCLFQVSAHLYQVCQLFVFINHGCKKKK